MIAARSTSVIGPILDAGGRMNARSTGEGLPFSSSSDTSASPTVNYPSILTTQVNGQLGFGPNYATGYSTVNGWSTAGTAQTRMPFVIKQGSNYFGQPLTTQNSTTFASSTLLRGFRITPPIDIEVAGWVANTGSTAYVAVSIYVGVPNAGALQTWALGTDTNQSRDEIYGSKLFPTPFILEAGVTYYVAAGFGTATAMATAVIEDYATYPSVFDALVDDFIVCPAVISAADGLSWNVRKDVFVLQQLIVTDLLTGNGRASYALGI